MFLAEGQAIDNRVLEGLAIQDIDICLIPIVGEGDRIDEHGINNPKTEKNRTQLLNKIFKMCKEDYVIVMEYDVILKDTDAIRTLKDALTLEYDIVALPTKPQHLEGSKGHALIIAWKDRIPEFKIITGYECSACQAIKDLKYIVLDKLQTETWI